VSPVRLAATVAFCVLLLPSSARAETASEMAAGCRLAVAQAPSVSDAEAMRCWGAFAVLEEVVWDPSAKSVFKVCAGDASRSQLVSAFVAYLARNPRRGSEPFTDVAIDALRGSFPCQPGQVTTVPAG